MQQLVIGCQCVGGSEIWKQMIDGRCVRELSKKLKSPKAYGILHRPYPMRVKGMK